MLKSTLTFYVAITKFTFLANICEFKAQLVDFFVGVMSELYIFANICRFKAQPVHCFIEVMSDLYIILLFSNALDTNPCSSSFCKYKTANSSKVSYTSFKTYQGKKLGVTTLIRKISVSSFYYCITNCSKDSNCSSVNYNQVSKEENCELLSENAYENRTDLKHFQGWKHATTYVSIL